MPVSNDSSPQRPRGHSSRSFSRMDTSLDTSVSPSRVRANTVHTPTITAVPEAKQLRLVPEGHNIFESSDVPIDDADSGLDTPGRTGLTNRHEALGKLPIEIKSFMERFLRSLSVKSHAAPLTIDAISDLFQDFYIQAESHISTHIAALTTRISREKSPAPSVSSRTSGSGKSRPRGTSGADDYESGGDQQMLTTSEITNKKKARRLLELQRTALEEAVERKVCEKVYDKIYRHRSTDDEERDAKLRSKTAALSLLGIGLNELHVNVPAPGDGDDKKLQAEIYNSLAPARDGLQRMDRERCPLGKIQHLVTAHQSIVETLARIFPSTSSADEVLPTLIYTLVTSPPETLNVASNLHFIQLFRATAKMDGEAAYCLVNLEAAISFLETVDLSSLRTDGSETLAGDAPERQTDQDDRNVPEHAQRVGSLTADLPAVSNPSQKLDLDARVSAIPDSPSQSTRPTNGNQRRISNMLQAQAERIEAGRENFLQSADQAFDSINSTLENSFKFLFGRLKEQEKETQGSPVMIPRTLDDARRLVKSPVQEHSDEALLASHLSLNSALVDDPLRRPDDKISTATLSRLTAREPSADSTKSGGSVNKRASLFGGEDKVTPGTAEAMGNFVTSLNPLSRFGVPSFPKFGRGANSLMPEQGTERAAQTQAAQKGNRQSGDQGVSEEVDLNAVETLAQLKKARPPIKRFLEVKDAKELRLGEVDDLLKDYRRLAELLGEAITSTT